MKTTKSVDLTPEQLLRREMATLRASQAPVLFFEAVCTFGVLNGVCSMTLDTGESTSVDGAVVNHIRTVAHVRFPVAAIASIRGALNTIEQQTQVAPLLKSVN
jgi:hypothetical protein